jgi:hypothetical protein
MLVSVSLEIALFLTQDRSTICAERITGWKIAWYSYVMGLKWILVSVRLEIVLILRKISACFCAEHTTGSNIILDIADRTPG